MIVMRFGTWEYWVGDRWDFKRKMKMGEEQTKDTCDIE